MIFSDYADDRKIRVSSVVYLGTTKDGAKVVVPGNRFCLWGTDIEINKNLPAKNDGLTLNELFNLLPGNQREAAILHRADFRY